MSGSQALDKEKKGFNTPPKRPGRRENLFHTYFVRTASFRGITPDLCHCSKRSQPSIGWNRRAKTGRVRALWSPRNASLRKTQNREWEDGDEYEKESSTDFAGNGIELCRSRRASAGEPEGAEQPDAGLSRNRTPVSPE